MIDTIIFDLDGILADTCECHYLALNQTLKEFMGFEIDYKDHILNFNGLPTRIKLEKLIARGHTIDNIDNIIKTKQKYTINLIKQNVKENKDKIDLLSYLHHNNYNIGCVTNCSKETALIILNQGNILNFIKVLITNSDVKKVKPDAEGYIKCMNLLNARPDTTLIIEDSEQGIIAAQNSGAKLIVSNYQHLNLNFLIPFLT